VFGDGPVLVVDEVMVVAAPGYEVAEVGWSASGPVPDVMDVAVLEGNFAAWYSAASVGGFQRTFLGWCHETCSATHIQYLPGCAEHGRDDALFTGDTAYF